MALKLKFLRVHGKSLKVYYQVLRWSADNVAFDGSCGLSAVFALVVIMEIFLSEELLQAIH